jgi:DNA-binding transcriptional LysR family regulator
VREAVRLGTGIAVLPLWLIEEDLLSGRLIRIYPVQRRLSQCVRTFIDFAVEYMTPVLRPATKSSN